MTSYIYINIIILMLPSFQSWLYMEICSCFVSEILRVLFGCDFLRWLGSFFSRASRRRVRRCVWIRRTWASAWTRPARAPSSSSRSPSTTPSTSRARCADGPARVRTGHHPQLLSEHLQRLKLLLTHNLMCLSQPTLSPFQTEIQILCYFTENKFKFNPIFIDNMCPWSTDAVISSTAIFVVIANNTLYGSKLYIFPLYQKS